MNDIQKLKQETDIVDVVSRYVSLKKEGIHHVGICPFHNDKHASLKVTPSKQMFKCFACGTGGDVVDFLTESGNTIPEAIAIIKNDSLVSKTPTPRVIEKPANKWNYTSELPLNEPTFHHFKHGQPSNKWAYHDENGNIISYVCRFDFPDGSKQVLPYSPITDGTTVKWGWKGLPAPKTLYNLHLIHENPKKTIIVVEGEKSADAGNKHSERFIFVSWIGGAKGVKHSDFKALNNRKVILWPDNDNPGVEAMQEINSIAKPSIVNLVKIPSDLPNKWDCADKEWQPKEIDNFITDNLIEVPTIKPIVESKPVQTFHETEYYRLLGYSKDSEQKLAYFFFSFGSKTVVRLTPTTMSKSNLKMLAPINYWEDTFTGNNGLNLDAAQNNLIQLSHKIGPFRDKFIRGRGAWIDNKKIIIHTGENIIDDGNIIPLSDFSSRYVYEINEDIHFGYENVLSPENGKFILDSFDFPIWERQVNSHLLAGWCVISPFCGILDWRPHVWITGPAGSSKSWIMDEMVRRLLGESGIQVQGKSTEAGIRGLLQSDARPLLYDEADVDDQRDKDRVQSILALARASSSKSGGKIAKGTQTGSAQLTDPRSCFALSSIGLQLTAGADKTRFTVLGLQRFEGKRTTEEFNDFSNEWFEIVDADFVKDLQARTLKLMPTILKNANVFKNAVTEHIGSRRLGDQVGILLAGAYSLTSSELVTYSDALEFVKLKDWEEEKAVEGTKDEMKLFNMIMGSTVRIDGNYERSIGELIMKQAGLIVDNHILDPENTLRRLGILIIDDRIYISNASNHIKKIIRDTSWSNNYGKLLRRIEGAEPVNARTYEIGVSGQRGTSIPMYLISDSADRIMSDEEYLNKNYKEDAPF